MRLEVSEEERERLLGVIGSVKGVVERGGVRGDIGAVEGGVVREDSG